MEKNSVSIFSSGNRDQFIEIFDKHLESLVKQKLKRFPSYFENPFLLEVLGHTLDLLKDGKRIRPYLLWLAYGIGDGKKSDEVLKLSASLELFHAFCLVHDDIIDQSVLRHSTTTTQIFVAEGLRIDQIRNLQKVEHIANSQAILVGDILYAWAMEVFFDFGQNDFADFKKVKKIFFEMINEVAFGQMLDVDLMTRQISDMDEIIAKMKLKTAGYTFTRPMQMGFGLAGSDSSMQIFAEEFGESVGIAFQILDDLANIFPDDNYKGKSLFTDIEDNQHTFLTQYVFENGSQSDRSRFQELMGKKISKNEGESIREIFERSGAKDYALAEVKRYLDTARKSVDKYIDTDAKRQILYGLIAKLQK
jgi:geranylgeranyl diphosphate synthase type I